MKGTAINHNARQSLLRFLVKLKLITQEQANQTYSPQEGNPISYFADRGYFKLDQALESIAKKLDITIFKMDFSQMQKSSALVDDQRLSKIAPDRWQSIAAIPVKFDKAGLTIAMANPLDYDARTGLEFDLSCPVNVGIASEAELMGVLASLDGISVSQELREIFEASEDAVDHDLVTNDDEDSSVDANPDAAPVIRLVNKIFYEAVHCGGSDIHITPQKERVNVRVRVDGIMRTLFTVPPKFQKALCSRIKLLAKMDISETRQPQDGRIKIKTSHGVKDLRVSTVPAMYGENIVARILASDPTKLEFDALGIPENIQTQLRSALASSSKVVLVSGPTGSGKTSSLYSFLLHLADEEKNIVTVEDPIEYRLKDITQIQVNTKVGMTFAKGLRAILRQDPDVVMVGEIRDHETAAIALQAAQTGHLVLSTIHTNSAVASITRLMDLEIAPYMISSSLGAVVAQRLVRKLCKCAEPASSDVLEACKEKGIEGEKILEPKGCEQCEHSGYSGRTGIYSVLTFDDAVVEKVRDGASEREIENAATDFTSLQQEGSRLVSTGVTSLEELERVVGVISKSKRELSVATQEDIGSPNLTRQSILLVEDDDTVRTTLRLILEQDMFDVFEATNGIEALELIYSQVPALVVSDIMMPKMSGLDLLTRIRKDKRLTELPVLLLTAADDDKNELQALALGVNDFVSKTASKDVMLARIHKMLT